MADPLPKPILHLLNGDDGSLRLERFWSKVDRRGPDECWPWKSGLNRNGYGSFKLASYRTVTASRVAIIAHTGQEPFGMHVLHSCDNPPCCNPAHLSFGTNAQNHAEKLSRGRARNGNAVGSQNGNSKLTEDDVAQIVELLRKGMDNTSIAERFPITHSMVSLIRLGKMWRPVTERLGWKPKSNLPRKDAA